MAGNSMIALMLMLLLCFIGMLVMFLFVIRSNTVLSDSIKEATRQQRQALNDIERQLLELSFTVNKAEVKEVCAQYEEFSQAMGLDMGPLSTVNPPQRTATSTPTPLETPLMVSQNPEGQGELHADRIDTLAPEPKLDNMSPDGKLEMKTRENDNGLPKLSL